GIICSDTSNVVTIVVNAKPNANAGLNKVLTCTNPTVTLDGSSTTTGVSYSWTGPGIVNGGSIATPVVNASGTYTLTVTVNSTNCQQTDNVDVTSNGALPNADAGLNKVITCTNPTVILDGSSTTSGVSYAWTGPGVVSGGATAKPTVNAAGAYTLTVTITATGCQQTDVVNVTNNTTLPNANAGSDKILTCILTDVLLDGSSTTSGVSYAWTGPGIVSGGATATPDVNKSGIYTLTVTNPVSGCKNTDQVEVFNNGTLPNADAGLDKVLTCSKTSVVLDGSSTTTGVIYTWVGPGILSGASSATPTVNTTGTYTVTVTETATGCKNTDQVLVTKNTALPNINAGNPKVLTCTATTVLLNGSSSTISANPSWAGPGIVNGQSTFTPTINTSGTYTLTMTDTINGCVASASILVTTDTLPPVLTIISSKNPAEYNEIINLTLNSNATISAVHWQPAALVSDSSAMQVSAQITSPTTFIVNATDSKGCSGTTSLFVNLFNVDCIYVPNTFTPDANGKNEVFKPLGSKLKTISIFRIFDRWGNMVFETTEVNQGWDGTYKGKLLEPGVYVYYIEGTCITNNKEIIKGDVTLIR
ncbi:MAG TPA: gliding motility-associated C-terminal domain-containing protein, partial [Chitinophagales bacterium]|nr:gliding motility-associated C-terminal domain-containing protein [Chitinophagales bacterium]